MLPQPVSNFSFVIISIYLFFIIKNNHNNKKLTRMMRRALAWLSSKPNKRGNGTKKRLSAGHTTRPIFEFTAAGYLTLAGLGIEGEAADWLAGRGTRGGGSAYGVPSNVIGRRRRRCWWPCDWVAGRPPVAVRIKWPLIG